MYGVEKKHPELGWISWGGVTSVAGDIWGGIEKIGDKAWDIAKETIPIVGPGLISYKLGQQRIGAEQAIAEEQIAAQKELAMLQIQSTLTPGSTAGSTSLLAPSLGLPISLPAGLTTKDLLFYGGIAFGGLALLMIFLRRPKKKEVAGFKKKKTAMEIAQEIAEGRRMPFKSPGGKQYQGDVFYSDISTATKKMPFSVYHDVVRRLEDMGFWVHS